MLGMMTSFQWKRSVSRATCKLCGQETYLFVILARGTAYFALWVDGVIFAAAAAAVFQLLYGMLVPHD